MVNFEGTPFGKWLAQVVWLDSSHAWLFCGSECGVGCGCGCGCACGCLHVRGVCTSRVTRLGRWDRDSGGEVCPWQFMYSPCDM